MAKTNPAPSTDSAAASIPVAQTRELRLGDQVTVAAPAGVTHLRNLETGAFFVPGEPTPQAMTPLLMRRLADGDLTLL